MSGAGQCYGINEGDLAIQFAVREGYPADDSSACPVPARSTVEEAQYMVPELRRRGVHRFILVTSDFHTRRASADLPAGCAGYPLLRGGGARSGLLARWLVAYPRRP